MIRFLDGFFSGFAWYRKLWQCEWEFIDCWWLGQSGYFRKGVDTID